MLFKAGKEERGKRRENCGKNPIYLCFVLPWTLLTDLPNLALIALLSFSLYNFALSFIELLKPGHTHKEWVRSNDQPA